MLLISSCGAWAQRHYQPGYVVLQKGDTLYGKIKDRTPEPFGRIFNQIKFRDGGLFARKLGPHEIAEYRAGERHYESLWVSNQFPLLGGRMVSMSGKGKQEFFRVVVKGKLNYYALESVEADSDYHFDIPYLKLEGRVEFVRATQGIFGLKRKLLIEYFNDCPQLQQALHDKEIDTVFEVVDLYKKHCLSDLYYNPDYDK